MTQDFNKDYLHSIKIASEYNMDVIYSTEDNKSAYIISSTITSKVKNINDTNETEIYTIHEKVIDIRGIEKFSDAITDLDDIKPVYENIGNICASEHDFKLAMSDECRNRYLDGIFKKYLKTLQK